MEEDYAGGEPKFRQIINDFQHFLIIRGDNHKFMEHLFSERLKVNNNQNIFFLFFIGISCSPDPIMLRGRP